MRDWHAFGQLTLFPLVATLLLHGLLSAALLLRWQSERELRTIEARTAPPAIIKASLIDKVSLSKRKPERKRSASPPRAESAPRDPAPRPARQQPTAVERSAQASSAAPRTAATSPDRPKTAAQKTEPQREDSRRISAEQFAAASRQEFAAALAGEEAERIAVTAEEMAASYAALIRETVAGYWNRPPSARNGMEVLLEVQLVPTGEVINVRLLRGSGDTAFDRSAQNAVERAGGFPELRNLPPREFERSFRRFQLLFRPEDLRY